MLNHTKLVGVIVCLISSLSQANEKILFEQLQQALRKHDLKTLDSLIAPTTRVEVVWADVQPKQKFTLSKAQYLQQIRALWRFGTEDNYQFEHIKWQTSADTQNVQVFFRQIEKRQLFNQASGQRSDISLSLLKTGQTWQIIAINAEINMW